MLATSCGTVEEYVLLNDLDVDTYYKMQPMPELHIKRGDNLRIVVTHKLPMLAEMFNNKINTVTLCDSRGRPVIRSQDRFNVFPVNQITDNQNDQTEQKQVHRNPFGRRKERRFFSCWWNSRTSALPFRVHARWSGGAPAFQ